MPVGSSAKMISRPARERTRHCDALLLPAGELRRPVREPRTQTDGVDDVVDPRLVGLAPGEPHRQRDVLGRRERRDQVERLEDEADAVTAELRELLVVELAEIGVADEDRTRR